MITTKGRTMNRLTELKQKTPGFGLRKRRSRRVSARGLASCRSISGSRFARRAYEQTNVGLQPVVSQRLKEAVKKTTSPSPKRVILLLLLLSTLFWAAGCEDYHSSSTGHNGPGQSYGGGSVDVADRDRPYYRGPGYWNGRVYYVWEPGHWAWRTGVVPPGTLGSNLPNNGQLLWIHGNYIAQGH
jgi:hypothetical protein